jgi:hypothetical protein
LAKEHCEMPPNSTQNLNAKLSAPAGGPVQQSDGHINLTASAIQGSAPPVRIVGAASTYHGGYHLSR